MCGLNKGVENIDKFSIQKRTKNSNSDFIIPIPLHLNVVDFINCKLISVRLNNQSLKYKRVYIILLRERDENIFKDSILFKSLSLTFLREIYQISIEDVSQTLVKTHK